MSISHLIPHLINNKKQLLNDHGYNWSERHLNVKINEQITNLKEINSYWTSTSTQSKITNTTVL